MAKNQNSISAASVIATLFWICGFALAFLLPKGTFAMSSADALLLLGFFPLLWKVRARWLWLVFGILNIGIGCVLLIAQFLPEEVLTAHIDLAKLQVHLSEYHFPYVWLIVGAVAVMIGIGRLTVGGLAWIKARTQGKRA